MKEEVKLSISITYIMFIIIIIASFVLIGDSNTCGSLIDVYNLLISSHLSLIVIIIIFETKWRCEWVSANARGIDIIDGVMDYLFIVYVVIISSFIPTFIILEAQCGSRFNTQRVVRLVIITSHIVNAGFLLYLSPCDSFRNLKKIVWKETDKEGRVYQSIKMWKLLKYIKLKNETQLKQLLDSRHLLKKSRGGLMEKGNQDMERLYDEEKCEKGSGICTICETKFSHTCTVLKMSCCNIIYHPMCLRSFVFSNRLENSTKCIHCNLQSGIFTQNGVDEDCITKII